MYYGMTIITIIIITIYFPIIFTRCFILVLNKLCQAAVNNKRHCSASIICHHESLFDLSTL